MAAYNMLHDNVEWLVWSFVRSRPEGRQLFGKLINSADHWRDDDVVKLIRRISEAVDADVNLTEWGNYFRQVKDVRDLIAHSMLLEALDVDGDWVLNVGHYHGDQREARTLNGNYLTVHKMKDIGRTLTWLMQQVEWVRICGGLEYGPARIRTTARPPAHPSP